MNNKYCKIFLKTGILFSLPLFFISYLVYSGHLIVVRKTSLINESRFWKISEQDTKLYFDLNRTIDNSGIFDGELNSVDINGFRILFRENSEEIYVSKNQGRFVRIDKNEVVIYKDQDDAPSIGTEQIMAAKRYINYFGEKFAFQDYGYDGIDVQYEIGDSNNAISTILDKKCQKHVTLTAGIACCKARQLEYTGFVYSNETGWIERTTPRLTKNCQSLLTNKIAED